MVGAVSGVPWSEGCAGVRAPGPRQRTQRRGPREGGERRPPGRKAQRLLLLPPRLRPPLLRASPRALTDEEDGESDEEQEDVRHHVERVHEATIVEDALVHPVGGRVVLAAAEGQGHGGAGSGCRCGWLHAPPALCPLSLRRPARPSGPRLHPEGPAPLSLRSRSPYSAPVCYLRARRAAGSQTRRAALGPAFPAVAARAPRCAGGRLPSAPLRACAAEEGKAGWVGGYARVGVGG